LVRRRKIPALLQLDPKTLYNIWALPLTGDRKPLPVVQTPFEEFAAQFSPDGKWIVFQSDESGRFEIYAQPFPGPGTKMRISTDGGAEPRWRRDGKEFYIALDGRLMVVPLKSTSLDAGTPMPLFQTRVSRGIVTADGQQYVVAQNGQRFLINVRLPDLTTPITVILHWRGV